MFSMIDNISGLESFTARVDVLGESHFTHMDVYETPDELVVELDMAGVSASDISVKIQNGWLVVEGAKREDIEQKGGGNFLCMERSFGPIKRQVKIPTAVDSNASKGVYKNGVLVIKLPKMEERRNCVRDIKIEETEG